tara:strand:- start:959 stop:1297 length:339 start_codon:yes stop_codon:yes gene_type:complete
METPKITNEFASIVFPKLIEDGKDFLLITMHEDRNDDENCNLQIRVGGAMMQNDGVVNYGVVSHYLGDVLESCKRLAEKQGTIGIFDDNITDSEIDDLDQDEDFDEPLNGPL